MWDDIELNTDHIPALKLAFHIGQFVCTLVLWCMEIAVFRAEGSVVNGNVGWTFAVCFLSIPAWIYLVMAPRFPRTRKFAQPYVMATLDGVFALIWISAFATQAAYNSANKCGTACAVSKACVAMGVFVFIFSCVTTFLSIWTVKYWQFNNSLPGYDRGQIPAHNIDPDKAAFSTAPHDDDAYERVNMDDHDEDGRRPGRFNPDPYGAPSSLVSDPYGAGPASTVGGSQVGSYVSTSYSGAPENPFRQDNPFDSDSEYHRRYAHPTAHDDLEDDRRPVAAFPSADYDRITR
ncbi:hypothetical protein B0T18DRAFT_435045 [Schizothecium vesticola]|uniref:MARVEL domain-containing protein n=1 Tax=Schizothecium vesticola TaxID=314040 RepID=A0AA40FBU5_9PEZI|nr:hypothetical protein B0T18DRAFT_435045 [Schizothecium vesticola]